MPVFTAMRDFPEAVSLHKFYIAMCSVFTITFYDETKTTKGVQK